MSRPFRALILATAALLIAPAVDAAPPSASPRAFATPWSHATDLEGADAVLSHAAGLAWLKATEIAVGVTTRVAGDEPINSVYGLFGTRLGPLAVGLGLGGVGDGPGTDSTTVRLDVGMALRLSPQVALGVQVASLYSDVDDALDTFTTWSASATFRPFRGLSMALGVEGFDTPKLAGAIQDAVARVSLGIRPGTERVSIGGELARPLSDVDDWQFGGNVRFMPIRGVSLGAYARYHLTDVGDDRVEAGAFLGLYQGGLGLETGFDSRDGTGGDNLGMNLSFLARARSERFPSIAARAHKVVRLPIRGPIPERPVEQLFGARGAAFGDWLVALDIITRDANVDGVLFEIAAAPSWGQCWELRQAIARLKKAGKRVHAVLTIGDMKAMYLASAADKIHLFTAGGLWLTGLSITRTYFLGLLEKLGVAAEFVKWDEFKSAPEALTRRDPSDPARAQTQGILEGVSRAWLDAVASGRKLSVERLGAILADGPQTMHSAVKDGLVDDLVMDDGLITALQEDMGAHVTLTEDYRPTPTARKRWVAPQKVAVIPVVGSIVDGTSAGSLPLPIPIIGGETTGDRTFRDALREATRDGDIIGIVIRVDTGGGSAIASDKMNRAVTLAAKTKPVVVSFGNAAASGGYYLAAGAPAILTTPLTVTGSIGIFTGKVDLSGLYTKVGVTTHTERTHDRADMMNAHRPWSETERTTARERLRAYYDRFVTLVSEGRELPLERAYAIAKGRVYLGEEALKNGLADSAGGLWDAIERVRAEAGIAPGEPVSLAYLGNLGALSSFQRLVAQAFNFDEIALESPALTSGPARELGQLMATLELMGEGAPLAMLPYALAFE